MTSPNFWRERLRKYRHTGWADQTIYAYDQQERLALIEQAVQSSASKTGIAVDFGCGTGDFSRLLLRKGYTVCGYDPFVVPGIDSPRYTYAGTYGAIPFQHNEADIAISVTVLDHILGPPEVSEALHNIRRSLKKGSTFIMLEYALDSPSQRDGHLRPNGYQAFRTVEEWRSLLCQSSFRVVDVVAAPHPDFSPSNGYSAYSRSVFVRLRRRLPRILLPELWYHFLLRLIARKALGNHPVAQYHGTHSPLKLITSIAE